MNAEIKTVTDLTNLIFSVLTILAQAGLVVVLVSLFTGRKSDSTIIRFLGQRADLLALMVTLAATTGSLFYSEIIGFKPCDLCWFQRIFMYPQVVLFGLAVWKIKGDVADQSIILSLIGGGIAAYNHFLQIRETSSVFCSTVAGLTSCSQASVLEFGYVTLPLMSLTAFLLIIALMICQKAVSKLTDNAR